MNKCRWTYEVERWIDGESKDRDRVAGHLGQCPACMAYAARLRLLREAAVTLRDTAEIHDAQFPAFMAGIRERVDRPAGQWRGFWALASLSAAALIVAVSVFMVFTGGPRPVDATVVESCSTEIEGARVTSYASDQGVATVWVTDAQDDMW